MRRPIRLLACFLHPSECGKYVSGSERRFLEISTRFRKLGVETFALEYKPSLADKWGYSAYHSIGIDRRFINHAVLETIRASLCGIKACIRNKCDIVYVPNRGVGGYNSTTNLIAAYVVSLLCQKPLIIVFHHLNTADHNNKSIINLLPHMHAKACIAVSHATADDVAKTFKVKRLVIATNGVNLDIFKQIKSQPKLYDAVFLGRITKEKGVFTLLKAWKIVTAQEPLAKLLLLGGMTELTKEACSKTINKLGLTRNVTVSGFVSDQEAICLLKSSRIFVLPSTGEGFGLAVAEAMAAGLPCILSNLPALKENFHSVGVFVEPKDVEGLVRAILDLLSYPEKCRILGERGQSLIERFSWDATASRELEIFSSLVKY